LSRGYNRNQEKGRKNNDPFIVTSRMYTSIKLVDENEGFHQSIDTADALTKARNANLDLVCFKVPKGENLAMCKIIDYGKWKYNQDKSKKQQVKANKKVTKEIKFSPVIDDNDIQYRVKRINDFLDEGCDVIATMVLRGRQKQRHREATEMIGEIVKLCADHGTEQSRKSHPGAISIRLSKVKPEGKKEEGDTNEQNDE
jgi:translation initiation factor IF-3